MEKVWERIKKLKNAELKTLTYGNLFHVLSVESDKLEVVPRDGKKDIRPIKREVFEKAFKILVDNGTIDLKGIREIIEFSPVYVMAILESFPEVQKVKRGRKIILKYGLSQCDNDENNFFPEEIGDYEDLVEGAKRKIYVNAYERNKEARLKCIEYHGLACYICGMKFSDTYGKLGNNFIHVHHIKELSTIGKDYKVDPVIDLIPVCPNCHAMLHYGKYRVSVKDLKEIVKGSKRIISNKS